MEKILERNKELIEKRLPLGLEILKKRNYNYEEIPVDDDINGWTLQGSTFNAKQYDIKEIGNLFYMWSTNNPKLMMNTMIFTPYYKQLPVFSTDHLYMGEKRNVLHELYDLVDKKYITETYTKYIKKFNDNAHKYDYIENKPPHNPWYEYLRSFYLPKLPTPEQDDAMIEAYVENMNIFLDMADEIPLITNEKEYKNKWEQNKWYSDGLLNDAGIATKMFIDNVGQEFTDKFFNYCFFAPETYRDKFKK